MDEDVPKGQALSRRLLLDAGCSSLLPLRGCHFGSCDRTIPGNEPRAGANEPFPNIRWMEIGDFLRRKSKGGTEPVKQIVFQGERRPRVSRATTFGTHLGRRSPLDGSKRLAEK
jgi:hypothetical protein